jgi:hypothetical protein
MGRKSDPSVVRKRNGPRGRAAARPGRPFRPRARKILQAPQGRLARSGEFGVDFVAGGRLVGGEQHDLGFLVATQQRPQIRVKRLEFIRVRSDGHHGPIPFAGGGDDRGRRPAAPGRAGTARCTTSRRAATLQADWKKRKRGGWGHIGHRRGVRSGVRSARGRPRGGGGRSLQEAAVGFDDLPRGVIAGDWARLASFLDALEARGAAEQSPSHAASRSCRGRPPSACRAVHRCRAGGSSPTWGSKSSSTWSFHAGSSPRWRYSWTVWFSGATFRPETMLAWPES